MPSARADWPWPSMACASTRRTDAESGAICKALVSSVSACAGDFIFKATTAANCSSTRLSGARLSKAWKMALACGRSPFNSAIWPSIKRVCGCCGRACCMATNRVSAAATSCRAIWAEISATWPSGRPGCSATAWVQACTAALLSALLSAVLSAPALPWRLRASRSPCSNQASALLGCSSNHCWVCCNAAGMSPPAATRRACSRRAASCAGPACSACARLLRAAGKLPRAAWAWATLVCRSAVAGPLGQPRLPNWPISLPYWPISSRARACSGTTCHSGWPRSSARCNSMSAATGSPLSSNWPPSSRRASASLGCSWIRLLSCSTAPLRSWRWIRLRAWARLSAEVWLQPSRLASNTALPSTAVRPATSRRPPSRKRPR